MITSPEQKRKSFANTAWIIETLYSQRNFWLTITLAAAQKGARGEDLSGLEESLIETFERAMVDAFMKPDDQKAD